MAARVLVVEDEPAVQALIRYTLEQAGMIAYTVVSAEAALDTLRGELPDVVLIDWMLPNQSGLALARQLRETERTADLPLIIVTARGEEADRVKGLEQGADDYVVKPFSPRELVARIQAVLRRRAPHASDAVLSVGGLTLNPVNHEVKLHGATIGLGPTEFRLLHFFLAHPERVYTRAQLLDQVWGDHVFIEERTVDVHIRRLRVALGDKADEGEGLIKTVRGSGYKLSAPLKKPGAPA
jgi:two-component system, OmpR family, phosphate regulon response regulator PhoB